MMGGFESGGGIGGGGGFPALPTIYPGAGGTSAGDCGQGQITAAITGAIAYTGAQDAWLQQWARALFSMFINSIRAIVHAITNVIRYLQHTWLGQLIKGIWDKVKEIYKKVQDEIKKIVCVLQAYEALVKYYQDQIFRPVLQLIQRLRRTLVLFRALHLKIATEIDNYLLIVEGRITNIELHTQQELNKLIDYLNLIVNPDGILNEEMYIGAAAQTAAAIWKIFLTKKNPQTVDQTPSYQTPAWADYNWHGSPAHIHELTTQGPVGMEAYLLDQSRIGFKAIGSPVVRP
jgi:hypothetical protein